MLTGLLIKNIKCLVQTEVLPQLKICGSEMSHISSVNDAYLFLNDGLISEFGEMKNIQESHFIRQNYGYNTIDATGRFVFPSYCDSHTHLVYAGSREIEYVDKIRGLSYEEIARRGGGIINSAKRLHDASEDELFLQSTERVNEIISMGTGAVEIKSGYGLTLNDELKMLRVIRRIKATCPIEV